VNGRKRTLVVDTLGMLLDLWVHPADIQDYEAGKEVLGPLVEYYPRMQKVWADGQFGKNGLPAWAAAEAGVELEIVKRPDGAKGFVVQAKRWIVERTLGWLNGYRRLSKDYEATTESSETMIYLAMIDLMVTRLAPT
jgi:putative transposase